MEEIVQLIGTYGFPIVLSVYLLFNMEKQRQDNRADSQKWCEAINRNTSVIEALSDIIKKQ